MKRVKWLGNTGKKVWVAVLLSAVTVVTAACSGSPGTPAAETEADGTESAGTEAATIESAGYDTPEAAVQAYLGFMKESDLMGMVGTYAIESYAEHYDYEAQLRRSRIFVWTQPIRTPNTDEFAARINIERRGSSIVDAISNQMIRMSGIELDMTIPAPFKDDSEIEAFMEDYSAALSVIDRSTVEMIGFIKPEDLSEAYDTPRNQENMDTIAEMIGAGDMVSVAAVFTASEQNYLLCCDAAQYGDRWYLVNPLGNIGTIVGMSAMSSGVMPLSGAVYQEIEHLIEPVEAPTK